MTDKDLELIFRMVYYLHEDPWCVRIVYGGNCVRDIEHGFYLCCELGYSDRDIFTLNKKKRF